MRLHAIRKFIICRLERRAYANRHKSNRHLMHWARMSSRRYRVLYPSAIQSTW